MKKYILLSFSFLLSSLLQKGYSQIQLTAFPDKYIYAFEESNKDSISNMILHNIGILNKGKIPFKLADLTITFYKAKRIVQQHTFYADEIVRSSSSLFQLQQMNLLQQYDFMFRTQDILQANKLTNTSSILSNAGLILRKLFFTVNGIPDNILIKASGYMGGKKMSPNKSIAVKIHRSTNKFIFPVQGSWFVGAGPSAHTHHRWGYMEEFAYDIVKIGENNVTYKGDPTVLENYYCYGKDILAMEDGIVESVLDGVDEATIYPKDLPQVKYMEFIKQRQSMLIEKYGMEGPGGNYIIIKHPGNEYSFYGHLKKGSLKIKKGDTVKQGQVIAQIGNSGSSTEPHLHFQLNENKEVLKSRSIPIRFINIDWSESLEPEGSYIKSGEIIKTK